MDKEQESGGSVGLSSWLVTGIEIQQDQVYGKAMESRLGPVPTVNQKLEVAKAKEKIIMKLNAFFETAGRLFPNVDFDDLGCSQNSEDPFLRPIPLPSQISGNMPLELKAAFADEVELRVGEANDALQAIRGEIGYKSYLFRKQIRPYKGKNQRTRGWDNVKRTDADLRIQVKIYRVAVAALHALDADPDTIAMFKPITDEDLATNTNIAEPNARGQSRVRLAWFWGLDVAGDSDGNEHMQECELIQAHQYIVLTVASISGQLASAKSPEGTLGRGM